MTIASRTPEGEPNLCPICLNPTITESSEFPTRDAPCPHCGSLLVFRVPAPVALREETRPRPPKPASASPKPSRPKPPQVVPRSPRR